MTRTSSTLAELMTDCDTQGIRLLPADGGGLTIDAPDILTPELLARLKVHKAELLVMLNSQDLAANPAPCPSCGSGVLWRQPDGRIVCECTMTIAPDAEWVVLAKRADGPIWEPLQPTNNTLAASGQRMRGK